jgi:hypothetical protein
VSALRFPAEVAVGEVWWEDAQEPGGWGHRVAIGVLDVPDEARVILETGSVREVGVYGPDLEQRPTWDRRMPDRTARNTKDIWGDRSYYVSPGEQAVDLAFIRDLPADSIEDLTLDDVVPASFPAVAHIAPGLRYLTIRPDWLDDDALSIVANMPGLEMLQLYGGSFTARGLQQLGRLPNLRHLHIEREGLPPSAFAFAANMPRLTRLTGPDEIPDCPMTLGEVEQLRALLPRVSVC